MVRPLSTPWRSLGLSAGELKLAHTLPTGQAFGWRRSGDEYHGVLGDAVVAVREHPSSKCCEWRSSLDREADAKRRLDDYFRTSTSFEELYAGWSASDARFAAVAPAVRGVRILRQDPFECLISFICSSNNNIARITLMLTRLREAFGSKVELPSLDDGESVTLHTFPSPDKLADIDDKVLRDLGFGYRAPYVINTCKTIAEKGPGWLEGLREKSRQECKEALLECSGVGPKVADCVALFSLDQSACIPVDTHVWRIARRDYDATLEEVASITPTVYERVGDLFRDRFGPTAGWAHAVLFAAELPAFRSALPTHVVDEMDAFRDDEKRAAKEAREARKARVAAKKGETPPPKPASKKRKPAADPEDDADLICRPKTSPAKPSARKPAAKPSSKPAKAAARKPAKKAAKPAARKPSVAKQAAKPAKKATAAKRPRSAKPAAAAKPRAGAKPKARRKKSA
jgi:N-glycosylase/DNA lyase